MTFGTPVQNFGSTTNFGSAQSFGGSTSSFGSTQNFGGSSQSFSGQSQSFTSARPQNFVPPQMPAGYKYSDNCWLVHDDGRPMSFGSRWGNVPNSTPRPSPGYRSPNDGLVFSSAPDIFLDANGNPLHAFTGAPVDRGYAMFLRATYPDRSWPDICKYGDWPAPGCTAKPAPTNQSHQAASHKGPSEHINQPPRPQPIPQACNPQAQQPQSRRAPSFDPYREPDENRFCMPPPPPNPWRHQAKSATEILEEIDKKSNPQAYERATIASAANRESFERLIDEFLHDKRTTEFAYFVCGERRISLAQKCADDMGFTPKGFVVETMIKTMTHMAAKFGGVGSLAKTLATEAAIRGTASTASSSHCLEIFNDFLYSSCMKDITDEAKRQRLYP